MSDLARLQEKMKERKFKVIKYFVNPRTENDRSYVTLYVLKDGLEWNDFLEMFLGKGHKEYRPRLDAYIDENYALGENEHIELVDILDHSVYVEMVIEIVSKEVVGEF